MRRLELLDYGRFIAAVVVVLYHYTFNGISNGKISSISYTPSLAEVTKYGYLGVELFFMISGYVIFYSARNRSASEFAVSRILRLYPAYWFAVIFTSLFAMQWGGSLMSVYLGQVIANMSMLQSFAGINHVDGVYWTLVYELSFYFAVFVCLILGMQNRLNSIFLLWPALFCVALYFKMDSLPYLGGYYYYFSAGALFAILAEKPTFKVVSGLLVIYALCMYFSAGKATDLTASKGFEFSPVVISMIVTLFFVTFIVQSLERVREFNLPMSKTFGALTYPLYLIHAHFGYMLINRFATENNKNFVYFLTIFVVFATALFMHRVVELRCGPFWKKFFDHTVARPLDYAQSFIKNLPAIYKRP